MRTSDEQFGFAKEEAQRMNEISALRMLMEKFREGQELHCAFIHRLRKRLRPSVKRKVVAVHE